MCRLGPYSPEIDSGDVAAAAGTAIRTGFTACVVSSNDAAYGLLRSFMALGVSVPRALSLIACEQIPGIASSVPALSTVSAPLQKMGRAASALLISLIESPEARTGAHLSVAACLTLGDTTAAVG